MPELDLPLIEAQARLGKSLAMGFVLSLLPIFGIATLIIGIRAKLAIKASKRKLKGGCMLDWCLIVGALETIYCLVAIPVLFSILRARAAPGV